MFTVSSVWLARLGPPPFAGKNTFSMNIRDTKETLLVTNADLSRSSFTDVNLHEARFADVNLSKAQFADINLSGSKFSGGNLSRVEIDDCNVTGMRIQGVLVSDLLEAYQNRPTPPGSP